MEDNQEKDTRLKNWPMALVVVFVIIAIIAILLFLMTGKTVITDNRVEGDQEESLACEATNVAYPFFTYDNSEKKELKINATFKGDALASISLVYTLTYANEDAAKSSELKNHIDFEVGVQNEGLTYASLNSDHKIMNNVYQLTLYNSGEDLNDRRIAKYYLLDSLNDFTQENVGNKIVKSGLNCVNK
ncbi:hypothetical protein IJH01_00145 [Candidatus Saccharibacteria bacterium]|nr:hypothetical protein [Candidatus Saccharibacteria bacterium]